MEGGQNPKAVTCVGDLLLIEKLLPRPRSLEKDEDLPETVSKLHIEEKIMYNTVLTTSSYVEALQMIQNTLVELLKSPTSYTLQNEFVICGAPWSKTPELLWKGWDGTQYLQDELIVDFLMQVTYERQKKYKRSMERKTSIPDLEEDVKTSSSQHKHPKTAYGGHLAILNPNDVRISEKKFAGLSGKDLAKLNNKRASGLAFQPIRITRDTSDSRKFTQILQRKSRSSSALFSPRRSDRSSKKSSESDSDETFPNRCSRIFSEGASPSLKLVKEKSVGSLDKSTLGYNPQETVRKNESTEWNAIKAPNPPEVSLAYIYLYQIVEKWMNVVIDSANIRKASFDSIKALIHSSPSYQELFFSFVANQLDAHIVPAELLVFIYTNMETREILPTLVDKILRIFDDKTLTTILTSPKVSEVDKGYVDIARAIVSGAVSSIVSRTSGVLASRGSVSSSLPVRNFLEESPQLQVTAGQDIFLTLSDIFRVHHNHNRKPGEEQREDIDAYRELALVLVLGEYISFLDLKDVENGLLRTKTLSDSVKTLKRLFGTWKGIEDNIIATSHTISEESSFSSTRHLGVIMKELTQIERSLDV